MFNLQAITVACLYLHQENLHYSDHVSVLATVTFVAYTIIVLILLIGMFFFASGIRILFMKNGIIILYIGVNFFFVGWRKHA